MGRGGELSFRVDGYHAGGLEVVCVIGVLQLVQKIGAKLGRRPVISSTAYSQFALVRLFNISN